jgi:hypothetical protein
VKRLERPTVLFPRAASPTAGEPQPSQARP